MIISRRTKPRPGRLEAGDISKLRDDCYERDHGRCVDCGRVTVKHPSHPLLGIGYHMAHKRNKRMWGDSLDQVQTKCRDCHIVKEHGGGKPVPRKPRAQHDFNRN